MSPRHRSAEADARLTDAIIERVVSESRRDDGLPSTAGWLLISAMLTALVLWLLHPWPLI